MSFNINWQSKEPYFLFNPKTPITEKNMLLRAQEQYRLSDCIFLATSGSTAMDSSNMKWVVLKKEAFLNSAHSVNQHLNCSKSDIFLNTLPLFHVGGLALFARAHLLNAKMVNIYNIDYKWSPNHFKTEIEQNKATITSLVPTQVYDLVKSSLNAPASLRAVVVGGGFLDKNLYLEARQLGWPLLPSYGMTECCSQVATASFDFTWEKNFPLLNIMPHLSVTLTEDSRIAITGNSLLTGYLLISKDHLDFVDPKIENKIVTYDVGNLKNGKLCVYGRCDENVKINGENVSLVRLQSILEQACRLCSFLNDCAVVSLPDARKGQILVAVFSQKNLGEIPPDKREINFEDILCYFNHNVLPYEKISIFHIVEHIPKTDLGKIKRNLLTHGLRNTTA